MALHGSFDYLKHDPFRNQTSGALDGRIDDSKSVKLYLTSPFKRDSAIIRPNIWTGSTDLYSDIVNLMKSRNNEYMSSLGGTIRKGFFLEKNNSSTEAMMPSSEWHEYKSHVLEDYGWQFILVITNEESHSRRYLSNSKKNRNIITGFCIGDGPVIRTPTGYKIDENAQFFITHQTTVKVDDRINSTGQDQVAYISKDVDVISNSLLQINEANGASNRDYILDPGEIMSSSIIVGDNHNRDLDIIDSPSLVSVSGRSNNNFQESSMMNSPKHQVNRVMSGLYQMTIDSYQESKLGIHEGNPVSGVADGYSDQQRFSMYLKESLPPSINSIDTEKPFITFRDIINRYPSVVNNIHVFNLKNNVDDSAYGFSELEKAPNIVNILSSLVKSALPPIMSECGLCELSFRWASSVPNTYNIIKLDSEPEVQIFHGATIIPESNEILRLRVHNAIRSLERFVFSIIKGIVGEFEIYVNYSSNKRTVISLQLRDMTDVVNDRFVIGQNYLGGIISPIIGTEQDYESHKHTLQSMMYLMDNFRDKPQEYNIASEDNLPAISERNKNNWGNISNADLLL